MSDDFRAVATTNLINSTLPEFSVQAFYKNEFRTFSDKDLKGKWSVLFFYPADFTFVCPTELEDLCDHYPTLQELGCEVYSVSTDTHFAHKAWYDSSPTVAKVKFPMLADSSAYLSKYFGTYQEAEGLSYRATFVVNPEGVIKLAELHDNSVGRDGKELVRKVKAAKFVYENGSEVCPAKWTSGESTLKPGIDLVGKI